MNRIMWLIRIGGDVFVAVGLLAHILPAITGAASGFAVLASIITSDDRQRPIVPFSHTYFRGASANHPFAETG